MCDQCSFEVEAWSDGNPYYRDARGRKKYAYHPDHDALARCIGNDVPHLCLACGCETRVDSLKPRTTCRRCKAERLVPVWDLTDVACPRCKAGTMRWDAGRRRIS